MLRSIALQTLRKTQLQTTLQLQPQQQRQQQQCQRLLVTAAQKKRALNDDQVYKGSTTTSTNTTSGNSSSSSSGGGAGSGGSGGGSIVPIVALVSAAAVGGAYYMDMIPANVNEGLVGATSTNKGIKEEKKDLGSSPTTPTEKTVTSSSTPTITTTPTTIDKTTKEKDPVHDVETTKEEKESVVVVGNRVINIQAPPTTGRKSNPVQPVQHNPKGSRVSVEKFNTVYGSQEPEVTESNEKEDEVENSIPPSMSTIIQEAEKELLTSSSSGTSTKIDEALKQAHVTMRATLDETFLRDLEKLSEHELRIRIVQLASEMGERTKWEAVRLREFLSMKEKEVADK
jgi:mitofilin